MIAVPRIPPVQSGQHLNFQLVNHIIKRTEYAGELLRQYRAIAGNNAFVEPHPDGTRISYLQAVGGGIPKDPILIGNIPWNTRFAANGVNTMNGSPQLYAVSSSQWSPANSIYAVWVNPSQDPLKDQPQTIKRSVNFSASGYYKFIFSADNNLAVYVDNSLVGSIINSTNDFAQINEIIYYVNRGTREIKFIAENTIGGVTWETNPAGYSCSIDLPSNATTTNFWGQTYMIAQYPNGRIINGAFYNVSTNATLRAPLTPYPDSFQMTRATLGGQSVSINFSYVLPQPATIYVWGWWGDFPKNTNMHTLQLNDSTIGTYTANYETSINVPAGAGSFGVTDTVLQNNGNQGTALRVSFIF